MFSPVVPSPIDPKSISNFLSRSQPPTAFKVSLIALDERLQSLDARIVHLLHDGIIVEAREEIADQVKATVADSMQAALERIISELPFVVEPRVTEACE